LSIPVRNFKVFKPGNMRTFTLFGVLFFCLQAYGQAGSVPTARYGFIENNGQLHDQVGGINPGVKFLLPASAQMNVLLHKDGFSYDTYPTPVQFHRLDVCFVNASSTTCPQPTLPYRDYLNYYTAGTIGSEAYRTDHFAEITYANIYPGIDVIFHHDPQLQQKMKYDFRVAPGADLSQVQLKYTGFDSVITSASSLTFLMGDQVLTENIPASWWDQSGQKADVHYTIISLTDTEIIVGFSLTDPVLHGQSLIIDPEPDLNWSTYYGDTLTDIGTAIITDNNGFIYATGITQSYTTLATSGVHQDTMAGGLYDAYVVKFHESSTRLWSTYFGGTGHDESRAIMVDTFFNVSITGFTDSPDGIATDTAYLPTLNTGTTDAFVVKFDTTGLRLWSTYFGGEGEDTGLGIDTDFDGYVYVSGSTLNSTAGISSPGAYQPASNGMSDAFLVKFDLNGIPVWSTYFGGNLQESGNAVTEEEGRVYLAGNTFSTTSISFGAAYQPALAGGSDGFVAHFSGSGSLVWSTYYGGASDETADDIEIYNNKIYLTGETKSDADIASTGAFDENLSGNTDAYLVHFDTAGTRIWATYFGGPDEENGIGLSLELDGGIFMSGSTTSAVDIATSDVYDSTYHAGRDAYLVKFDTLGNRVYCTYFGAGGDDIVQGIDVYGNTSIYMTGYTASTDSLTTSVPSFQPAYGGGDFDAFVARFTTYKSTPPCTGGSSIPTAYLCYGDTVSMWTVGGSLGTGANWAWYVDGCGSFGTQIYLGDTLVTVPPPGSTTYFVRAESINNATQCLALTIITMPVPDAVATSSDSLCPGSVFNMNASGGDFYDWSGPDNFSAATASAFVDSVSTLHAGEYVVTVTDNFGCKDKDTISLFVFSAPSLTFQLDDVTCAGGTDGAVTAIASGNGPFSYLWNPGGSTDSALVSIGEGVYYVTVADSNNCAVSDSIFLVDPLPFITGISSLPANCTSADGSATVTVDGLAPPYLFSWAPSGGTAATVPNLPFGNVNVTVTNGDGCVETAAVLVDSVNNLQIAANTVQHELCVGVSNGEAIVNVIAGAPPYNYNWTPGMQITPGIDSLSPGSYYCSVTDNNGCLRIDNVTIQPAVPLVFSPGLVQQPTCGLPNGSIEVLASGGTGNFMYDWDPVVATGYIAIDLDENTYVIIVYDDNNCSDTLSITLTQLGIFELTLSAADSMLIAGESTQLTGIVQPDSGNYTYTWFPAVDCPACPSSTISPGASATYYLFAENDLGCSDTGQVLITVIPCSEPFIPTIFSPNDDGLNDSWGILGGCITEADILVFDRWGQVVFSSQDISLTWDGTFNNTPVVSGNYTYQVHLELQNAEPVDAAGVLTVTR
jgi:gliding motility-associated-like protein